MTETEHADSVEPTALTALTKGGLAAVTKSLAPNVTGEILHIDGGRTA